MRRAPVLRVAAGVSATAAILPAVYLIVRASAGGPGVVAEVLIDGRTAGLLVRTLGLTVFVTAAATVIGVALAWLTVRTDLPGRGVWVVLSALPLTIPSYVAGYALVAAFGPRGLLQRWLQPLGVDRLPSIYGFAGAALALTLITYPYVMLSVRAALLGLDPALEDQARSLGSSRRGAFVRVVVPQLRPSVASGALLVALYALHDFGAVSLLRYDTFTRAIYVRYQAAFDRTPAAILGLVLVGVTLVVLGTELRARGRAAYHTAMPRRAPQVARLGSMRFVAAGGCAAVTALAAGVPVLVSAYWLARAISLGEPLRVTLGSTWRSVSVSAIGALAATAFALPVAWLSARHPARSTRIFERASYVGYALPGVVVALSLVFFATRAVPALYQTVVLLAFAYAVLFLPQALGPARASLLQISPSLEDAARSLGSTRLRAFSRVAVPLMRPGVAAGAAMVFLTAMKELPATLLLAPTGFRTLATQVWSATSEAFYARAAAPSLVLVGVSSVPLAVLVLRAERSVRDAPAEPL